MKRKILILSMVLIFSFPMFCGCLECECCKIPIAIKYDNQNDDYVYTIYSHEGVYYFEYYSDDGEYFCRNIKSSDISNGIIDIEPNEIPYFLYKNTSFDYAALCFPKGMSIQPYDFTPVCDELENPQQYIDNPPMTQEITQEEYDEIINSILFSGCFKHLIFNLKEELNETR